MNDKLTKIYQDIMSKNFAVKTGRLKRSIKIETQRIGNILFIKIKGLDYLNEVDERHSLTLQFMNSKAIEEILEELIVQQMETLDFEAPESASMIISDFKVTVNTVEFKV